MMTVGWKVIDKKEIFLSLEKAITSPIAKRGGGKNRWVPMG